MSRISTMNAACRLRVERPLRLRSSASLLLSLAASFVAACTALADTSFESDYVPDVGIDADAGLEDVVFDVTPEAGPPDVDTDPPDPADAMDVGPELDAFDIVDEEIFEFTDVELEPITGDLAFPDNLCAANVDPLVLSSAVEIAAFDELLIEASCENFRGTVHILDTDAETISLSLRNVDGDLIIEDNDEIVQIAGLTNLRQVLGVLRIVDNDSLRDLDGLASMSGVGGLELEDNDVLWTGEDVDGELYRVGLTGLNSVAGDFVVRSNDGMAGLYGFSNLEYIDGSLIMDDNELLNDIEALEDITSIGGDLVLSRLDTLNSLDALTGLESIGGTFRVSSCDALLGVSGFDTLARIDGSFIVYDNDRLLELSGYTSLSEVGGSVAIGPNTQLDTIYFEVLGTVGQDFALRGNRMNEGLLADALVEVGRRLDLRNNASFTTPSLLPGLRQVGLHVIVRDNPALPTCRVDELVEALEQVGGVSIEGNNDSATCIP